MFPVLCFFLFFFRFFFFNDTATTEIYTLSLHDALPIRPKSGFRCGNHSSLGRTPMTRPDRKSTRLNSSHVEISYAVFCLKKKKHMHIGNWIATSHILLKYTAFSFLLL